MVPEKYEKVPLYLKSFPLTVHSKFEHPFDALDRGKRSPGSVTAK
jgi:hypothetical protein